MIIATNLPKRISILTKVIESLDNHLEYSSSNALSHALLMRADCYIEQYQIPPTSTTTTITTTTTPVQENTNTNSIMDDEIQAALHDAIKATSINHLHGRSYRVQADAYELLGDILKAMEAVEEWAKVNPAFMSKAKNELSRLSSSVKKM